MTMENFLRNKVVFLLCCSIITQAAAQQENIKPIKEEQLVFKKPYVFISLGEGCKTAAYLRDSQLTSYAYPFDWMLSCDFESIYRIITNNFDKFMDFDQLKDLHFLDRKMNTTAPNFATIYSYRWILETVYDIESRHDFDQRQDFDKEYPQVMEKVNRRVKRFIETLKRTDITVFLVRSMVTKEQALRFRNLIKSKFPELKFVFVALSNTEDFKNKWHEQYIENFYFNEPVYVWDENIKNYRHDDKKHQSEWNAIVSELRIKYNLRD